MAIDIVTWKAIKNQPIVKIITIWFNNRFMYVGFSVGVRIETAE